MNPTAQAGGLQLGASCDNRLHDRSPGYVDRSVPISRGSEPAPDAFEISLALPIGLLAMPTLLARTRRIARVDRMQRDTRKSGFIGKERTKLSKGPTAMAIALRASNRAIGTFPNVPKLFNRYSLAVGLRFLDNSFGDHMIRVGSEPTFFAGKLFEVPFCALRPTLLQALTQGMHPLAGVLNLLTTEGFTFRVRGKVDNAQIYTQGPAFGHIGCGFRHVKGHSQVERAFPIEQIGLPLDGIHASRLIATDLERNQHTTRERQEGDRKQALKAHDSFVIDDGPLWLERGLDALIALVGLTRLADGADGQLSSKCVGGTQLAIHHFLQCKLVGCFLRVSNACDIVARRIKRVHRLKQGLMLFGCGNKLQEHRLFHGTSVLCVVCLVNEYADTHPLPQIRNVAFLPVAEARGILRRFW